MADLTLQMINFLKADATIAAAAPVIDEQINGRDGQPFIYIRRSGGESGEAVNCNEEDSVFFDVEITGDDINAVRDVTELVKAHVRQANWPSQIPTVQFFDVGDHDDSYVRKTNSDDTKETAALQIRGFTP